MYFWYNFDFAQRFLFYVLFYCLNFRVVFLILGKGIRSLGTYVANKMTAVPWLTRNRTCAVHDCDSIVVNYPYLNLAIFFLGPVLCKWHKFLIDTLDLPTDRTQYFILHLIISIFNTFSTVFKVLYICISSFYIFIDLAFHLTFYTKSITSSSIVNRLVPQNIPYSINCQILTMHQ